MLSGISHFSTLSAFAGGGSPHIRKHCTGSSRITSFQLSNPSHSMFQEKDFVGLAVSWPISGVTLWKRAGVLLLGSWLTCPPLRWAALPKSYKIGSGAGDNSPKGCCADGHYSATTPVLQMRKLRLRDVKKLVRTHKTNKWYI